MTNSLQITLKLTLWGMDNSKHPLQRIYHTPKTQAKQIKKSTTLILVMSFLINESSSNPLIHGKSWAYLGKFDLLEVKHNHHDRIFLKKSQILEITTASTKSADEEQLLDHLVDHLAKIFKISNLLGICARKSKIIYIEYTIWILAFKINKRVAKNIMPTPNALTISPFGLFLAKPPWTKKG